MPPIFAAGWLKGGKHQVQLLGWVTFFACAVSLSIPWLIAITAENSEFIGYFLWKHNLVRFVSGFIHQQPWWFYLPIFMAGTFPASLLMPALVAFLFSRDETIRQCRGKELGFLLISTVWVIGFFSLSGCKLATYILPALPLVALLLGCLVEHCVLKPEATDHVSIYLRPFPRRASAILISMGGITVAVELALIKDFHYVSLGMVMLCVGSTILLAYTWKRNIAQSHTGWAFTTLIGIISLAFIFGDILPTISNIRSVHGNAALMLKHNITLPVVYFDRETYAATLYVPKQNTFKFGIDDPNKFASFMIEHPQAIVVTSTAALEVMQKIVSPTSDVLPAGGRNHVHVVNRRRDSQEHIALTLEPPPSTR